MVDLGINFKVNILDLFSYVTWIFPIIRNKNRQGERASGSGIGLRLDEDQGLAAHFYGDVRETVCKAWVSYG